MPILGMRGPQFLFFYLVLSACVYVGLRWLIARREQDSEYGARGLKVREPYEIAYLRGGVVQLTQVATLSLIRRNLLGAGTDLLRTRDDAPMASVSLPIEAAILNACRTPIPAVLLERNPAVLAAAAVYRQALSAKGLIPDDAMLAGRKRIVGIASALLAGLAVVKVGYALMTGHENVFFLIVLALIVVMVLGAIVGEHRTRLGRVALQTSKPCSPGSSVDLRP